jgi:hypothetical protein
MFDLPTLTDGPRPALRVFFRLYIGPRVTALQPVAAFPEGGVALGKTPAACYCNAAGMGKEYNVMGVTGGVFGDTEVASGRRDTGPGQALKEFVDRLLQLQISG